MSDSRRTWAGTRSDIERAVREAVDAVNTWSPYGAETVARISYKSGLTERRDDDGFLQQVHRSDLVDIDDLQVDIEPSRQAFYDEQARLRHEYYERQKAALSAGTDPDAVEEQKAEPLPQASVGLQFSRTRRSGLSVDVRGPTRDRVEGLHARLLTLLSRRQSLKHFDVENLSWLLPAVLTAPLILLGLYVTHWAKWAKADNKWEWQEIVAIVVGGLIGLSTGPTLYLLYPQLELFEDGQSTRAERFGKFVLGAAVTIIVGVIAAAIYAHA